MWHIKKMTGSVCKVVRGSSLSAATTFLFVSLAFVSTAQAQVSAQVNIGVIQPSCSYGYYDYAPYGCAPMGFYGPGYFYNGIFLGVGPWSNWGYGHGWGEHRFSGGGGGRYVAHGNVRGRAYAGNRSRGPVVQGHSNAVHGNTVRGESHAGPAHGNVSHGAANHGAGSHPAEHGHEHPKD